MKYRTLLQVIKIQNLAYYSCTIYHTSYAILCCYANG